MDTLPQTTTPDLAALPVRVDRKTGAELVTRFYFPTSARTLEAWHLPVIYANGKALIETADLLDFARRKIEAAPKIMGGRPPRRNSLARRAA